MPVRKKKATTASEAPPPGSLATATVTTPATPQKPNNPYYVQAAKLARAKDKAGLKALDKQLADAGYAETGQTRQFIADSIGGSK
jgi:hypothetical protein